MAVLSSSEQVRRRHQRERHVASERHGPIPLPHHRQVIRRCLAYRILVGPLTYILLSKQDADGTFQNLDVKVEDVPVIATRTWLSTGRNQSRSRGSKTTKTSQR